MHAIALDVLTKDPQEALASVSRIRLGRSNRWKCVTTCARNAKIVRQIGHSARPDKPLGCREYFNDVELNKLFGNAYSTFLLAVSEVRYVQSDSNTVRALRAGLWPL